MTFRNPVLLDHNPVPVFGVAGDGIIAVRVKANAAGHNMFASFGVKKCTGRRGSMVDSFIVRQRQGVDKWQIFR